MTEQTVVTWYIPGQVIYIGWGHTVTMQELGNVSDRVTALMDTASGPVYILNDARRVRQHPQHPLQVRHTMTFLDHPRLQCFASVTSNAVLRFMATVVPQMISFTESNVYGRIDEALLYIRRTSVNDPLAWEQADDSVLVMPAEAPTPVPVVQV
jgi:hypothetical protein